METILKIWNWLSGKKTVIGSVCLWIGSIFLPFIINDLGYHPAWFDTVMSILNWLGGVLAPLGVMHKAAKIKK